MNRIQRVLRRDEGSVMVLGVGMVVVIFTFVAGMTDIAVLRQARQDLLARADAAALAGAQIIDVDALTETGYEGAMPSALAPLDRVGAQQAALAHLRAAHDPWREVHVLSVSATSTTVVVRLEARVVTPFIGAMAGVIGASPTIPVRATAAAQTRVG